MQPVEAPPLLPPTTGLIQAALIDEESTPEPGGGANGFAGIEPWLRGITFSPESAAAPDLISMCSEASVINDYTRAGQVTYSPFVIEVHDQCSSYGFRAADYEGRAARALEAKESWALEREFEQGILISANPHLAVTYGGITQTLASGAVVGPSDALALLDEAIANARIGIGMIHAPAFVVSKWGVSKGDDPRGGDRQVLLSPMGNIVVGGTGYTGLGPDGTGGSADATHSLMWAYATDLIEVVRSDRIDVLPGNLAEATNRATNTVTFRGVRPYGIKWAKLLHAAVKINVATPPSSGAGATTSVAAAAAKQLVFTPTRLTGGADRSVPAGRRSVSVTVITKAGAGSPTWDGVELDAGWSGSVDVDYPGDTLPAATIATAAGDVVLVLETS